MSRLDKIRVDQGARAAALEQEAAASEARATLIEYNLDTVDAAIDAVNAGETVDWTQCIGQGCGSSHSLVSTLENPWLDNILKIRRICTQHLPMVEDTPLQRSCLSAMHDTPLPFPVA
jgi:hypothetical protein